MLLNNLGTEVGLTNGTLGKLIAIGYLQKTSTSSTLSDEEPPVLFIQFPTLKCNTTALPGYEKVIPITFMSSRETYAVNNNIFHRWQMPLTPAAAITVHKAQGFTAIYGIVYSPTKTDRPFARGLEYVAISRVQSFSSLWLLNFLKKSHFDSYPLQIDEINTCYDDFRNTFN